MPRISSRLANLSPSATLAVNARARELAAAGREIISFGAGEPDFATAPHIVEAAIAAARDPRNHHYTANVGHSELRQAIVDSTLAYSGISVDADQVLVTNGGKQAIYQAMAALVDPGDEVLLPTPYWVTYPAVIELAGGTVVEVPATAETGYKVGVDDLESARTKQTKVLLFVSPSNPTGAVYTPEEVKEIGSWAGANGIWVMCDEIYQRLVYGDAKFSSLPAMAPETEDRWVLVNGVAKSYAMTGWRVGWMVGPRDVVAAAGRLQSHATSNVANVSQAAATAALSGPQEVVEDMRRAFDRRRRLILGLLSGIEGLACPVPEGAFYVFPDVRRLLDDNRPTSSELVSWFLEEAGVAFVAGESFGAQGHMRVSYALGDDEIERGMGWLIDLLGR